jgi:hypothetical protein
MKAATLADSSKVFPIEGFIYVPARDDLLG